MTVCEVVEALAREVDRLDPARTSGPDAARLVGLFDRAERLGAAGKTLMAARAVECNQWARDGAHSAREWLSQVSGVPLGSAQRTLETAEQVAAQPDLADAVRSGELSAAQAAEISSAVAENPAAAPRLIGEAKKQGFKGLRKQCRAARLAARSREDDEATARRQRDSRYLRMWAEPDGTGRIDARLDPLSFTTFASLFRPFEDQAFDAARKAGVREPLERYRADALLAMAQAAGGTSPAPATADPGQPKHRVPTKVVVIVDRSALVRGHALDGETCEIQGFGPVPVAVARMIMGDAFLAAVVTDGVDIRSVVHLGPITRRTSSRPITRSSTNLPICARSIITTSPTAVRSCRAFPVTGGGSPRRRTAPSKGHLKEWMLARDRSTTRSRPPNPTSTIPTTPTPTTTPTHPES